MRLQYRHHLAGPGRIVVKSPDLPVYITIDEGVEYRSVDVLADRGLAARAGSTGTGGVAMMVEIGRPSMLKFMMGSFGLNRVTSVSRGESAISQKASVRGRGTVIQAGGDITGNALGKEATVRGVPQVPLEPGVHITAPPLCTFEIRAHAGITVLRDSREASLEYAESQGWLAVKR